MQEKNHNLAPTNELVAGILATRYRSDQDFAKQFRANPKKELNGLITGQAENGNDVLPNVNVQVVQNTNTMLHVPLPCYEMLANKEGKVMTDDDLMKIAGGEIAATLLTAFFVGLGAIGTAVTLGAAAGGTAIAIGAAVVAGTTGAVALGVTGIGLGVAHETGQI